MKLSAVGNETFRMIICLQFIRVYDTFASWAKALFRKLPNNPVLKHGVSSLAIF